MSLTNPTLGITQVVAVNWDVRWQVYQRLQQLEISSECLTNQPLRVQLLCPNQAIQLWCVVKQLTASRHDLVNWLNGCWLL